MRATRIIPFFLLATATLLLVAFAPPNKARPDTKTALQAPQRAPRELDFPFYSIRDGFSSLLQLVSDLPEPFSFRITVHSLSGKTAVAPPITVQPQEKLSIDMQTLLTKLGVDRDPDFEEGSISVSYVLEKSPLLGQVTISNPTSGVVYESLMAENDPEQTAILPILEGLWWGLTPGREGKVMVANTSNAAVNADVYLSFGAQRYASAPLVFRPYETKVLSIKELVAKLDPNPERASEGGITIMGHGTTPALIATGLIADRETGFSTTMHFMLMGAPVSSTLYAPGVPIGLPSADSPFVLAGTFTPHVIVRNLLSTEQTATITLEYPSADGSREITLAPLTLGAYATKDLVLDRAVLAELPLPVPYCSIRVQYSGRPGSAIVEVSSLDQNQNLVVDSKLRDPADRMTKSGINPWHLDDETEAVLFLTNAGESPARIGFQIQAEGVHYYLTDLKLNPRETRAIDIRQLRDMQQPDFQGNRIPPDATDGSLVWMGIEKVPVVGRLLVLNSRGGVSSNFDCTCTFNCPTGYVALDVIPDSKTLLVNGTQQFTARATYGDCFGTHSFSNVNALWTSNNFSVCTVNGSGLATAVGPGSANIDATYSDFIYRWFVADRECRESLITKSASASVTVKPTVTITSASNFAFVGSDPSIPHVLFQAVGNPTGGTYSWTASPSNRVSFDNPSADVVALTGINPSTSVGDTTLTVNYTKNGQNANPATRAITARIFKFLRQSGTVQIVSQPNGYIANAFYNIFTNPGGQMLETGFGGIAIPESVTLQSATRNGVPLTQEEINSIQRIRGAGATNQNSQIVDDLSLLNATGGPLPSGLVFVSAQDIFVGGLFVRSNTIEQRSENIVTITNLGPTN